MLSIPLIWIFFLFRIDDKYFLGKIFGTVITQIHIHRVLCRTSGFQGTFTLKSTFDLWMDQPQYQRKDIDIEISILQGQPQCTLSVIVIYNKSQSDK